MSRSNIIVDPERLVFAMDIGTRSIVGLVCYPENEKLRVLSTEIAYHPQRDMLDGQIHNIEGVTETARSVKNSLEKRLGVNLERVAIAAAGRALRTCHHREQRQLEPGQRIRKEEIASLELEAVEKAKEILMQEAMEESNDQYYCVGYTTVGYYLDGYPITSLVGQRGEQADVEVLATFLPQVVVDSLLTVVEEIGLTIHNLTLEPIAALNVTIPQEYRSLNLALVDIGAGTSDIAITHKGAVVGYAMVPLAGDEITEAIAETYLLDFNTAEEIKLKLTQKKGTISFKDIIGNSYSLSTSELQNVIEPVVEKVASKIASTIIEYNNGPPRAVFCIGGGSQTPLLQEKLAEKLELPANMVATRGREVIKQIVYTGRKLKGPESITPFGIAISAQQKEYFGFSYITVNGKVVRLLDTADLKVGNALVTCGYQSKKLLARRGPSLNIVQDGKEKNIPGTLGENARILVNGQPASLETIVKNNDQIQVLEAQDGQPPRVTVNDLYPSDDFFIYVNDEAWPLPPQVTVNGEPASADKVLKDGDRVSLQGLGTLQTVVELAELEPEAVQLRVNGHIRELDYKLQPGDRVTLEPKSRKAVPENTKTEPRAVEAGGSNTETSSRTEEKEKPSAEVKQTNIPVHVRVNGEEITLAENKSPTFVDIFNYINFDRSKPRGKLIMTLNGQPASLTAKLKNGDEVYVYWEKEQ